MCDKLSPMEKYNLGLPIFISIFNQDVDSLRNILAILFRGDDNIAFIVNKGEINHVLSNGEPSKITLSYYDEIHIDAFGIYVIPEHNNSTNSNLRYAFNEAFKVPCALEPTELRWVHADELIQVDVVEPRTEEEEWADYIDHMQMLFDNGIKWSFKHGNGKSFEEMKSIAKENGLSIVKWRSDQLVKESRNASC